MTLAPPTQEEDVPTESRVGVPQGLVNNFILNMEKLQEGMLTTQVQLVVFISTNISYLF